jgi:hypothetical protein
MNDKQQDGGSSNVFFKNSASDDNERLDLSK